MPIVNVDVDEATTWNFQATTRSQRRVIRRNDDEVVPAPVQPIIRRRPFAFSAAPWQQYLYTDAREIPQMFRRCVKRISRMLHLRFHRKIMSEKKQQKEPIENVRMLKIILYCSIILLFYRCDTSKNLYVTIGVILFKSLIYSNIRYCCKVNI